MKQLADWVEKLTRPKKLSEFPLDEWLPFQSNNGMFLRLDDENYDVGNEVRIKYYKKRTLASYYDWYYVDDDTGVFGGSDIEHEFSIKALLNEY